VRITIITMLLLSFEISGATAYSSKSNLIGIWEPFEWQREREVEAFKQDHLARSHAQASNAAAVVMLDGGRVQTRAEPSGPGVTNPEWHEPKLSQDDRADRLWAMPRPYRAARHKPIPAVA